MIESLLIRRNVMKKYYDFVFLTKKALVECLEQKVNNKTKIIYLSQNAKNLLGKDNYKGVPVKVDNCLKDVYMYIEF